jgi:hypothetical protein
MERKHTCRGVIEGKLCFEADAELPGIGYILLVNTGECFVGCVHALPRKPPPIITNSLSYRTNTKQIPCNYSVESSPFTPLYSVLRSSYHAPLVNWGYF